MRVAVIGAGPCGLPTIKTCLEEGLEVVCFEYRDTVGGLWNYSEEELKDGIATTMHSTVANLSKVTMSFSDFPAPRDFPQFPPHFKMLEYYKMYAEHFRLLDHIRFRTEAVRVKQYEDNQLNAGQWQVTTKSLTTNETVTEIFDAVLVCTGHLGHKYIPEYEGAQTYQGQAVHSHDYRRNKPYKNKKVVVVGSGNSAFDIAVDLSTVCSQVYLSTRRGAWMVPRLGLNGLPLDIPVNSRFTHALKCLMPRISAARARSVLNSRFNHTYYGLEPPYDVGAQTPTVNDFAPNAIARGAIIIKPGIRRLTSRGVVFGDGTNVENVDVIIYATGFSMDFSFIEDKAFEMENQNDLLLYKMMFAPGIQPPTLAIIGCVDSAVSSSIASEMQARFVARVLKGTIKLPNADEMRRFQNSYRRKQRAQNTVSTRQYLLVDPLPYMDSLAAEIGCSPPSFLRLLLTDPKLCWAIYIGMFSAHQYRLVGPGAWSSARQALLGIMDRLQYPVNSAAVNERQMKGIQRTGRKQLLVAALMIGLGALAIAWIVTCC